MKNSFQHLFSKKARRANAAGGTFSGHRAGFVHRPYRDWQIMLAVFGLLAVASVFWGFNYFREVNSGDSFMAGEQAAAPMQSRSLLNQPALNAVTAQFQAKTVQYSAELSGGGTIADPSK